MLEKITWPVVVLVGLAMTCVSALAIVHVDSQVITNLLLLFGLGGGLGVLSSIRSNVNGNLSALIDHLAKSTPPTPAGDERVVDERVVDARVVPQPATDVPPGGILPGGGGRV